MTVKPKEQYFQMFRGIAIILVILIHCFTGLGYSFSSLDYHIYMFLRSAFGIAVPLFFAMSGYFSYGGNRKNKIFDMRLILPFIVWSGLYQIVFGKWFDLLTVKGVVKLITGQSAPHLYFVFVLIQIRILLPFIKKTNKKILGSAVVALSLLWYCLYYMSNILHIIQIPGPFGLTDFFPAWILYWYIGYSYNDSKILKKIKISWVFILTVVMFMVTVTETYYFAHLSQTIAGINPVSQIKLSNLLFCCLVCILVFKLRTDAVKKNLVTSIGDCSYGIYYIHFMFILIMNKYFPPNQNYPLLLIWFVQLGFALSLSIIVIKIVKIIFGKKLASKIFGF